MYQNQDRNKTKRSIEVMLSPSNSYPRATVRKFMFQYYANRISWSRTNVISKEDGCRFWFVAKGVKEYLFMLNQENFTYAEI